MLSDRENELISHLSSAQFNSTTEALEFSRQVCLEQGFILQCEPQQNNTMHLSCFLEQPSKKKVSHRPDHKFLLSHHRVWSFQRICPDTHWPQKIRDRINQLLDKEPKDILKIIQTEFPEALWDDRPLTDYWLKKRQERVATERVQRLTMASTRLCTMAASNEDWTTRVESELDKMLKKYSKILKVPNDLLESMVDIQLDKTCLPEKTSEPRMVVPGCTLFVRSQHQRAHVPERTDVTFPMNTSLMEYFREDVQQQQQQMIIPPSPYTPMYPNFYPENSFSIQGMQRPHYVGYNSRMVMQPPRRVQSQQPDQPWH
ncbi:unnamed protein product [Rhizopus stolonifer]